MSWEHDLFALLDDLEGQAAAAWEADREAELADRARTEYGAVTLASRLMASRGRDVAFDLPHVGRLEGRLARVGEEWCLLDATGQDWIVPLRAVTGVPPGPARRPAPPRRRGSPLPRPPDRRHPPRGVRPPCRRGLPRGARHL